MRIAFDVSPLSHPATGVGNYIRGTLQGLLETAGGRHEVVAFAPTSLRGPARIRDALDGLDVELSLWPLPASHAVRTAWSRAGKVAVERLLGPFDVLHFTDWMYPPQRAGIRATTIHDLVPLRFPEWTTARTRAMHGRKYTHAARTCDVIFANSAYTAGEIADLLGVDPTRLRVAYPGVKSVFHPEGPSADLGDRYILTVATLEPRKNLETLVRAHRLLPEDVLLAVAGGAGWGDQPDLDHPRVRRLGFVPDDQLAALYRGAQAAVYPSRFEGFGMPIVESMACGTVVVASSHLSMDEASGDIAFRADPDDAGELARAIDEALRAGAGRRAAGLEHAARFTWRAAGEAMLAGYEAAR